MSARARDQIAVVAIGRNEGQRLVRCLASSGAQAAIVVYVDSGSTDGSVAAARAAGAEVVALDLATPFTAARARNEGFQRVRDIAPQIGYVQFVDGDCELASGWLERALGFMVEPRVAIVVGRRRERHPEQSIYNRLCDMEWATPVGEAMVCGGDALVRVAAFEDVRGYEAALIAGEEPDLCVRLRARGWRILRVEGEMTIHDAAMHHFWQWWRRNTRAGHAYAEGWYRHRGEPERFWRRDVVSNLLWGLFLPLAALGLAPVAPLALPLALAGYGLLAARVFLRDSRSEFSLRHRAAYALACAGAKLPQAFGQLQYFWSRLRRRTPELIEYKGTNG